MADEENKTTPKKPPARKPAAKKPVKVLKVAEDGEVKQEVAKPKAPTKKPVKEKVVTEKQPTKLSKEKAAQKTQEAKELSDVIKELGKKNEPTSEKELTKLAKDTIKMVTEAQRSGSLAFKRESTKALVQIRTAVDKMAFAKDANKEKLMADIDGIVLDAKNVTLYMVSMAKAQVDVIKAKGQADAKQIKSKAATEAKLSKEEAKTEAKRIAAQADLEAQALKERVANELKVERADQIVRLKRLRLENQDRAKRQREDGQLQKLAHHNLMEDTKRKAKEDTEKRLKRVGEIRQDLRERKDKQNEDHKERMDALRDKEKELSLDYKERRDKQKADARERIARIREKDKDRALEFKNRKEEARAKIQALHKEIRGSKNKSVDRDAKKGAKDFLGKVGGGIADANPLLALAYTITKGMKDTTKMLLSKRESKRDEKKDLKRVDDIHNEKQNLKRVDKIYDGDDKAERRENKENHEDHEDRQQEKKKGLLQRLGSKVGVGGRNKADVKPVTNAPQAVPKAGTVAPSTGESNTPDKGGLGGVFGFIGGISKLFSSIGSITKVIGPLLSSAGRLLPGVAIFAVAMNAVFDFIDGFNNAGKLFTDTLNPSFMQKIFAGFTNIGASIVGLADSVLKFFGVDLDLKGKFEAGAKSFYEATSGIVDKVIGFASDMLQMLLIPYRYAAGKMADLLTKLPFIDEDNAAVKGLRSFSKGGASSGNISSAKPAAAPAVTQKQATVNKLQDDVDTAKAKPANTTAVVDNSIKTSNTTVIPQKLSTRNSDHRVTRAGYGSLGV